MPFGKYRDQELDELPSGYLRWLADLDDLREPLKSAVEEERERRAGGNRADYSQAPDFRIGSDDRKIARQIIVAGRRSLAKVEHPDRGGELVGMQKINTIADAMLEALR